MKIYLVRRKHLMICAGVLVAVLIFLAASLPVPAAVSATAATRELPIYCVDRSDNTVAISFDAAWGEVILRRL